MFADLSHIQTQDEAQHGRMSELGNNQKYGLMHLQWAIRIAMEEWREYTGKCYLIVDHPTESF